MLNQMRFLSESLAADLAPKRLLACVCSQVDLDVALVQESTITNGTPVNRFLFAANQSGFCAVR